MSPSGGSLGSVSPLTLMALLERTKACQKICHLAANSSDANELPFEAMKTKEDD